MMTKRIPKRFPLWLLLGAILPTAIAAQDSDTNSNEPAQTPSIEEKTRNLQKHDGFIPFFWDEQSGSILLEIDRWNQDLLYVHSLATGLGSNPVGLDRGQLGSQKVVQFQRVGPKILLVQRNLRFRAISDNERERRAVEESFAQSVIWGGAVSAETDGRVLVDATSLLLGDSHGVIETLSDSDQGDFTLDETRSAVFLARCKGFPQNTELEATLTFVGKSPGRFVQQTTPTAGAISLRQHHSFVQLPDDQYIPRKYDVRSPSIFITYADYASPLNSQLQQRWIVRHRLMKEDPQAKLSPAVEPIIYYVDPGAPKQIQEALKEGARWWNEAFEAAGFKDAFEVRILPDDVDPMDVRYNVIQWVHRSTRGWSYGSGVVDPRTGEILKGHVTLGSLRVRQDQLIVHGLHSWQARSSCACCGVAGVVEDTSLADLDDHTIAMDVALARIRQLSAHEVGHTLGFVHNFAASTYGNRASVMDYPAPRVKITESGKLDLSDAYGVGIGSWDKLSVKFAYSQFADGVDESEALDKLLTEARENGMTFISDDDARPEGASQPYGNLWDNGSDPVEQLRHVMKVRALALKGFDPNKLPAGTTNADIAQYLTPLFLHHRYQLQAAGKMLGGYDYEYGYAGQAAPKKMIPPDRQLDAAEALMMTIDPAQLRIPEVITAAISPRPYSTLRDQEILPTTSSRNFDPLAAARVAVNLTLDELFQPQRLANLAIQSRLEPALAPSKMLPSMVGKIWENSVSAKDPESAQIGRIVREAMLEKLIVLIDNESVSGDVKSAALDSVRSIAEKWTKVGEHQESIFRQMLKRRAEQVLSQPHTTAREPQRLDTPPGSPIGG